MTSPVYLPVYPDQVPPADQQGMTPAEKAVVAALAAWLATSAALTAVFLPAALAARLVALGLAPKAVRLAGRLALTGGLVGRGSHGVPTTPNGTAYRDAIIGEPGYRAQFLVNSAKRMAVAHDMGVADIQLAKERAYLAAHRRAARNRTQVAADMDEMAQESPWLEWHCKTDPATGRPDDRVTPDCRAMHGQIFTLDQPPAIGWPGAVHPRCRCRATPFGVGLFGAQSTVTAGVGAL
jgi:SPP1 gp7 family putative phage head morphogenesis protein